MITLRFQFVEIKVLFAAVLSALRDSDYINIICSKLPAGVHECQQVLLLPWLERTGLFPRATHPDGIADAIHIRTSETGF